MKKFYKLVSTLETPQGWGICLDGRPVKTTMGRILTCATPALAEAIMQEWAAQTDSINPQTMPLTQILSTQIDQVAEGRSEMSGMLLKYLDTDLLCYRAGPEPEGQVEAQAAAWNPWLDWFETRFGVRLETTETLAALRQPEAAHEKLKSAVAALDDARFTALQLLTPLTGSVVLALAFVEGALTPEQAFAAMRVEENFKAEIYNEKFYGPDPAQEKKDQAAQADLKAAAAFLRILP
ncbi:MAG: ATP12 chaperone family protein [Alphaproteobacteria bacterium]|nr:ATP12 chaperone family protein [Alphaproteobacteria bacterium]